MRISNSFSEGEVQLLEFIFQTLLRGGSPTMAARHKEFASVYRKVISMKQRIEKTRTDKPGQVPEKSAVGTIASPDGDESALDLADDADEKAVG